MQYIVWRTLTNRHTNVTLSFFPVGHTKRCKGLFTFDAHLIHLAIPRRVMHIRIHFAPVHIVLLKFAGEHIACDNYITW